MSAVKAKIKRIRYTDEQAIKAYIMCETTEMTQVQIGEKLGISTVSVHKWAKKVRTTAKLKAKAQKQIKARGSGSKRTPAKLPTKARKTKARGRKKNGVEEIQRLLVENSYLRWRCIGHEVGFVARLVEELRG